MNSVDGIYTGYFSGREGEGLGMFLLKDGLLTGADAMGVLFDGSYSSAQDGQSYEGKVTVTAPPNGTLVQGVTTGPSGMVYEVSFHLPSDFSQRSFLTLSTALGPVNVKLVKLRSFDAGLGSE